MRAVKPGDRVASDWIISEGLKPGETVVVEGVQKVRPGSLVTPRPYAPPPAGEKAATPAKPADKG